MVCVSENFSKAAWRERFEQCGPQTVAQIALERTSGTQQPLNTGQWRDAEYAEVLREHNEFMKKLQEEYQKEKEAEQ
jgi:hypothetical protein